MKKNKQKVTDFFSMRVLCTLLMVLKFFIKILKNEKKKVTWSLFNMYCQTG